LIFFGMLSLILFRGSVIVYTSLQGSVMLVFGIFGLIYKYQSLAPDLTIMLNQRTFMLPALVFVPAIIGLLFQQQMHPEEPAPASSGGSKKSSS
jgi:hypothetical protein